MSDYVIFTDANTDMTQEMVDSLGVQVLPMRFMLNEKEYYNYPDGREIDVKDFYSALRAGASTSTSQTNTPEYVDIFRPAMQEGKDVLYLGFSSGLSGTVNAAALAVDELMQEFPDRTLVVVDTLCASLGEALMVWQAATMQQEGQSLQEVATWVLENRHKVCHWFTVDDLNFLKRGGRVSGASALMGTMLNIKPVMRVNTEGKLEPVDKVRGRKNSLNRLVDEMEKAAVEPASQKVFIAHADCPDDAQYVADEIKRRFGTTDIVMSYIGPVIGGHAGPNTLALFYMGESRG